MSWDDPHPGDWNHPGVRSSDELTLGERTADHVVSVMGSWGFIIAQSIFMAGWMVANVLALTFAWDPYPFVLLNLALSTQAAFAASLILIAQKRTDQRSKELAEHDYETNQESLLLLRKLIASEEVRGLQAGKASGGVPQEG